MARMTPGSEVVLALDDVAVEYESRGSAMRVLPGVSLELRRGEVVGLVGESGSGKSTLALAILRLLPANGRIVGGEILLDGSIDLARLGEEALRETRGPKVAMVFQDPLTSLNPTFKIGGQMVDVQAAHTPRRARRADRKVFLERAISLLGKVGLPDPGQIVRSYPISCRAGCANGS
jgi:ABC-type dipeptide/oligopeptide/nickel transport system ATPase component